MRKSHTTKHSYPLLNIIFILLLIYSIQDFLTSKNTGASIHADRTNVYFSLVAILFVLGIYYLLTNINKYVINNLDRNNLKCIYKSKIHCSLWIIFLWVMIVNLFQPSDRWIKIVHLGLSFLWILSYHFFKFYLRKYSGSFNRMQLFIFVMFLFYVLSSIYSAIVLESTYQRTPVLGLVYSVLVFLPWISLIQKKHSRYLCFFLSTIVVVISMKRGAIVVFPLMLCAYSIVEALVNQRPLTRMPKLLITFSIFIIGLLLVDQWSSGFLTYRLSYDNIASGSGRIDLYRLSIIDISQRSTLDFFIGKGSGSSIEYLGTGAHNEWLEFLFTFGLIGLAAYIFFIFAITSYLKQLIRLSSKYAPAYAMAVVYMVTVGMYGGIYFVHSTFYIMAFIGASESLGYAINQDFSSHTTHHSLDNSARLWS